MKIVTAALAVSLLSIVPASAQDASEAEPYVLAFCGLRGVDGGLALINLASPALSGAIREAMAKNAAAQAAAPDDKPPLGDGIPWQGSADVAPICEPGTASIEGEEVLAQVEYRFPDTPSADFSDTLVFVKGEGDVLLLDDVRYAGEGSLRETLADAFD